MCFGDARGAFRIMKIAVFTKQTLLGHPVRAGLLDALSAEEDLELVETEDGAVPPATDRALAFGGDGTMLEAAVSCARADVPLLGINCGNLGFLTQFDCEVTPEEVASALRSGAVKRRALLICKCSGGNFHALNDIVIKSASTRPVSLELYIDGGFADAYRSDGVIVATPTGSTAYSLSAGGPVLAPELDAMVITAMCPHTLHSRPMVINGGSDVVLRLIGGGDAVLVVDGDRRAVIAEGSEIRVSKADISAPFIDAGDNDFYKKLLDKMNRWGSAQSAEVKD